MGDIKYYNRNCNSCGNKLGHGAVRERNKEGDYTGRWLCKNCGRVDCEKNIDMTSSIGKGFAAKQITRVARKIDCLNTRYNNVHLQTGHFRDYELGLVQSRLAVYNSKYERWNVSILGEQGKKYDNIIIYCISSDMKDVERVYIIPKVELANRAGIAIAKDKPIAWYEKYKVDEKPYNDVYHSLIKDDLSALR